MNLSVLDPYHFDTDTDILGYVLGEADSDPDPT